jgi:cell division protein FtsN
MSRDYKSSGSSSKPKKGGNSLLTGVLIGIFVGLAVALAVALAINFSPSPFKSATPPQPLPQVNPAPPKNGEKALPATPPAPNNAETKPRFDFYKILPGIEEPVTENDLKQSQSNGNKDQYYLQAGAFQSEAEADNLKAKLALMGVEASIQTATLPDKGVWHRVRVGPFTNVDELNKARTTLAQNGIQSSLVKVREDSQH